MNRHFLKGRSTVRQHHALPALRAKSMPATGAYCGQSRVEAAGRLIRSEPARHSKSNSSEFPRHLASVGEQSTRPNKERNNMTIKVLVMSDRPDEYTGKKGLIKQQIITVMDLSETGERLAQPIEYAMSDEEKPVHAGKLQDKVINLGIRELLPFGGRLRARGKIVGLVGK